MRKDALVEGSQLITRGTKVLVAYDWVEADGQPFAITEAYAAIYDSANAVVIAEKPGEVEPGLGDAKRTQVIFTTTETDLLTADDTYYILWRIVLSDSQTRKVRAPIRVRGS